jgi:hypothetical protein
MVSPNRRATRAMLSNGLGELSQDAAFRQYLDDRLDLHRLDAAQDGDQRRAG